MKANVIYPKANDPEMHIHDGRTRENQTFEYDTKLGEKGTPIEEILEEIWEAFNIYSPDCGWKPPAKNKTRSMMVGDIVHFPAFDQYYVVASCGFKQFTQEQIETWYEVPMIERNYHDMIRN